MPAARGDVGFIYVSNLSPTEAVDVQFHATNDPLTVLPDDLFVEATATSTGIGVAGTGIIQPLDGDLITFPCTADLSLGTAGAIFNGANEAAVEAFLAGHIPFGMITELVGEVLGAIEATPIKSLSDVMRADEAARTEVARRVAPRTHRACDDAAVRSSAAPG